MYFQILDNRPAVLGGQGGAVFVSSISVPIGIRGVSNKGGILERRLIGYVANVLWIKKAAADHERLFPIARRCQQFPQIWDRAVIASPTIYN